MLVGGVVPLLLLLRILQVVLLCRATVTTAARSGTGGRQLVLAVDGGTESIRAGLFDSANGRLVGTVGVSSYPTYHPQPGWAEQDPHDWWDRLGDAVRQAVTSWQQEETEQQHGADTICAMAIDTTCCSVVALDKDHEVVLPCLLWMDQRSAQEAAMIVQMASLNEPALAVNNHGLGPVSAEWMTPKALWLAKSYQHGSVWDHKIKYLCEYQDYINYRLTGILCASACNAATRWHWDGDTCTNPPTIHDPFPGRPMSLYKSIGIPELAGKLPQLCHPMGAVIGPVTREAAGHLNLPFGLPVIQGGPDAFVGMVGLGCIRPGQMCLITGSSHLHCVVARSAATAPGIWGAYRGAPFPDRNFAEGGQSSTGSMMRWMKRRLFADDIVSYRALDDEAATVPIGADGLVAVETFQGSRTPVTDPFARGGLFGLTLSHTRAHIWRAGLEAVCYGTRSCLEALDAAGHACHEIILAGGVARSELWLRMHADVTGKPVVLCENGDNAPLLGCAILASYGAKVHPTIETAVQAMVRTTRTVLPNHEHQGRYDKAYSTYLKATEAARHVVSRPVREEQHHSTHHSDPDDDESNRQNYHDHHVTISPSLLACDWADMRSEVRRCLDAGLTRLHVDVFDGVFLNSPAALTFGPQMVAAIRRSCDDATETTIGSNNTVHVQLDVHLCVDRPDRFVNVMAAAGVTTLIFQWEAMEHDLDRAVSLCHRIRDAGMRPGVSINPATPLDEIIPLLEVDDGDLVGTVDILAVEPGFGGQTFQPSCLAKINALSSWRQQRQHNRTMTATTIEDNNNNENGETTPSQVLEIMVDGGINTKTASSVIECGVDILVAGTSLFQNSVISSHRNNATTTNSIGAAARILLRPSRPRGDNGVTKVG